VTGADVRAATSAFVDLLVPAVDRDWSVTIPDMEWTVATVVAHVAETCLWYAIDLSAGGRDLKSVEQRVKDDGDHAELLANLQAYGVVFARVLDGAAPRDRGFHPDGLADPSGFAAMGCDELLVHADDTARGLGLSFAPDEDLCERTLRRLFPEAPDDVHGWSGLRWANGRIALPDHERRTAEWQWHCAPLDEWDGRPPS